MAVTRDTIPAHVGEVLRLMVNIGNGGSSQNTVWLDVRDADTSNDTGSVSSYDDLEVTPGLEIGWLRWRFGGTTRMNINRRNGNTVAFSTAIAGVLAGKHMYIAYDDDTSHLVDRSFDTEIDAAGTGYMRFVGFDQADAAILDALSDGDPINIVFADPALEPVDHDRSAAFTLGAPGFSAAVGKTALAAHNRAASFALGAPSFSVALGKTVSTVATLNTIPTQEGVEYIRVLLTMGPGTPSGTEINLRASQSYVTQTGDEVFDSTLSLDGIDPHAPGDIRLRPVSGGSLVTWKNAQARTPKLVYASSADGATVRQATEGSVGSGYWNWNITDLPSSAQVGDGDTINLVIYVPPAPVVTRDRAASFALGAPSFSVVLGLFDASTHDRAAGFALGVPAFSALLGKRAVSDHDRSAGFTLGAPGFSALVGKTALAAHDSAASFALGAPSFSVVLGRFDASLHDLVAGFALGAPTFSVALGKVEVAAHNRAAGFALGVPSFSAVLGKTTIAEHASSALFTMGAPLFSVVLGREDATTQDRPASFVLGAPVFSVALGKITIPAIDIAAAFALGSPSFSVVLEKRSPADRTGPIVVALTNGVATLKSTLLAGGLLRAVEWIRRTGQRDVRGRQTVTTTLLDALIESRPALDRSDLDTDRADDTVLVILDPVAISDSDTFRWGGHIYKVQKIDGVIRNEATGVRFSSEVTVIR